MNNAAVIAVAAAVFSVAIWFIVRELRTPRAPARSTTPDAKGAPERNAPSQSGEARASQRPAKEVPVASAEPEPDDITRVGLVPKQGQPELPRLGLAEPELEEPVSESSALTLFEENAEIDEPTGPVERILIAAAGQTDQGMRRRRNEDSYLVDEKHSLFVVADGMGGYAGGDVASRLATETIREVFASQSFDVDDTSERPRRAKELVAAIEAANAKIHAEATANAEYSGMGTTIVATRFSQRKQRVFIAHVGDSRCYRLRAGELKLMTTDHTYAVKGVVGPMAANIRRAVGIGPKVKVDLVVDCPMPGDVYLLCSDGLNKMVTDHRMRELLNYHRTELPTAVQKLIDAANASGGKDNTTIVLVGVRNGLRAAAPAESVAHR